MAEKKIDFRVNYKKLNIFEEFNTKDIQFPVVLSSPHSGRDFPPEFLANSKLSEDELRSSEDSFVTEIVRQASDAGIPLLSMNIPGLLWTLTAIKSKSTSKCISMRRKIPTVPAAADAGGTRRDHRIVSQSKNIYDGLISYDEAMERIKNVYDPYHKRLKQLVDKCVRKFGLCVLIDCHSMPSMICNIMNETRPLDFCLCTLFDESCPTQISENLSRELKKKDYRVEFNRPYAGAYIAFNYCQPQQKHFHYSAEINALVYDEK